MVSVDTTTSGTQSLLSPRCLQFLFFWMLPILKVYLWWFWLSSSAHRGWADALTTVSTGVMFLCDWRAKAGESPGWWGPLSLINSGSTLAPRRQLPDGVSVSNPWLKTISSCIRMLWDHREKTVPKSCTCFPQGGALQVWRRNVSGKTWMDGFL